MNVFVGISAILPILQIAAAALNGHFLMIGDVHLDLSYRNTSESCNDEIPKDQLGDYGNYECDTPLKLAESAFTELNKIYEANNVDFIVWMGDTPGHMFKQNDYTKETFLEVMKKATDLFAQTIKNKTLIPVIGNHDYFPRNQLPGENSEIYDAIAEMWKEWLPGETFTSFKNGGFYTIPISTTAPKARVIVLNTNLYSTSDRATEGDSDPGMQLMWMEDELEKAVNNDEKVHIFMHIPTGAVDVEAKAFYFREDIHTRLNNIIRNYSSGDNAVVLGVHGVHVHTDSFKMYYDNVTGAEGDAIENAVPLAAVYVTPSVTPWRRPSKSSEARNPALRMFDFDTHNLHLTDIKQYYLELPKANDGSDTRWKLEYSYKDAYGLPDVKPASLHQLLLKLRKDDSPEFDKYFKYNFVSIEAEDSEFFDGKCDCQCKAKHLCAIAYIDVDTNTRCYDESYPKTCNWAIGLRASYLFIALFLLFQTL